MTKIVDNSTRKPRWTKNVEWTSKHSSYIFVKQEKRRAIKYCF